MFCFIVLNNVENLDIKENVGTFKSAFQKVVLT